MGVIINDFEAVADAPEQRVQQREGGERQADKSSSPPEPQDIAPALLAMAEQALRSWAH